MSFLKKRSFALGILLGCAGAIATGVFGIFFNYFDMIGLSSGGRTILTPCLVFFACFSFTVIKNPKLLIPKEKKFLFTMIVISGGILYSTYNYAYVMALDNLPMSITALFNFSNAIVLVVLLRLFFKEAISKKKIICCSIALIGILLVLEVFSGGNKGISVLGVFWGITVTISLALAYTIDYFHIKKGFPFYVIQTYTCLGAIIAYSFQYSLLDLCTELGNLSVGNDTSLWIVLFIYFNVVVVSYVATTASYNFVDASYTSLTYVLEPVVAAVSGFLIFKERLTNVQIIGIMISVIAIVLMQYIDSNQESLPLKKRTEIK